MAADGGPVMAKREDRLFTAEKLRLVMPENTRFEPIYMENNEESTPEAGQDDLPMAEDMQKAVGVSISRAQTRMASAQTPFAEKAAAIEGLDGVFDDGVEDEGPAMIRKGRKQRISAHGVPKTPPAPPSSTATVPSPWRADSKFFERPKSKEQAEGLSSMLPDVNLRRYMPSLPSMPDFSSIPRVSSFRGSVPSLGSILGTVRSRSPGSKVPARKKRASTVINRKSDWETVAQNSHPSETTDADEADRLCTIQEGRSQLPRSDDAYRTTKQLSRQGQSPHVVRRATSDQSLQLRKATSTTTSLGDDTRWDNVSQQVNSRAKAIRDSFQDSTFKRYSRSNVPFSFRPEILRSRTQSGAKPTSEADKSIHHKNHPSLDHPLAERPAMRRDKMEQGLPVQHPHLDQSLAALAGDLVVLGGYRGSILRSAKPPNRQLWVPVKVGLNIRKANLEVGLEPEDEERMEESIYAEEMLSHIGPVDMGRRLLKKIRHCKQVREGNLRLHEYGYDWRLSPHLLSRKLVQFLESLPSNRPGVSNREKGATVICHSMGGLITRHAVNQRPELFAGVVYVGVPQHCINILGPFRNGDEVLLSSKVLTAQTNFSMRSSFVLLPDDGYCFINKDTGEEYPVNFHNEADWEKYAWSPCISTPDPAPTERKTLLSSISGSLPSFPSFPLPGRKQPELQNSTSDKVVSKATALASSPAQAIDPSLPPPSRSLGTEITIPKHIAMAYLRRTLAEILRFRHELAFDPPHSTSNAYPPLALIYANNTPTVLAAKVESRAAIKRADAYEDLKFGSGDGVVLARSAMLPPGYMAVKGGKVKTQRGHVGLLGDLEAVGKALLAVGKGRKEGVGLGVEDGTRENEAK